MFENIYDFGANRGQNLRYFLNYTKKVIAVEPIPELFEEISNVFKKEIISKKINALNLAIVTNEQIKTTKFYINEEKNWESTLLKKNSYNEIEVPAATPKQIFDIYGYPDLLKIDVENFDIEVLKFLKSKKIVPKYLIFEVQNPETLDFVLSNFEYKYYNIVLGHRVEIDYPDKLLENHSSGPIFTDLKFKWVSKKIIYFYFKICNYGWIDVHCTDQMINNKKSIGITLTIYYLFKDRIYRIFNPYINRVKGKFKL